MAPRVFAAVILILLGSVLAVPIAILLGTVALLLELVHYAWARTGLTGVRYSRVLGARHVAFGDDGVFGFSTVAGSTLTRMTSEATGGLWGK